MVRIQHFTEGKSDTRNEDAFGNNDNSVVLSDGATDKSGEKYDGKTGGEIISKFVVEKALESDLNGAELVKFITKEVQDLYKKINPKALEDPIYRFSATLVCVRVDKKRIHITQIGDSSFRINGVDLYQNNKHIDEINAEARSRYILETGDIEGGRTHILSRLKDQYRHQNNPDSKLGYGFIDGTEIPEKFIKAYIFPASEIKKIELISDGYFSIPHEVTIEAYESAHEKVEKEDPDKYKIYKSTKSKDDRTIVIIDL